MRSGVSSSDARLRFVAVDLLSGEHRERRTARAAARPSPCRSMGDHFTPMRGTLALADLRADALPLLVRRPLASPSASDRGESEHDVIPASVGRRALLRSLALLPRRSRAMASATSACAGLDLTYHLGGYVFVELLSVHGSYLSLGLERRGTCKSCGRSLCVGAAGRTAIAAKCQPAIVRLLYDHALKGHARGRSLRKTSGQPSHEPASPPRHRDWSLNAGATSTDAHAGHACARMTGGIAAGTPRLRAVIVRRLCEPRTAKPSPVATSNESLRSL